jgi:hypothetical protein
LGMYICSSHTTLFKKTKPADHSDHVVQTVQCFRPFKIRYLRRNVPLCTFPNK